MHGGWFRGWPQEWVDGLQQDFELVLSDEEGEYDQNIKIVGQRFFGRHTFGTYDLKGVIGEFIYYQLAHHAAFQIAEKMVEEQRRTTPARVLRLRRTYNRVRRLGKKLRPSVRAPEPSGHTGPREVK